MLLKVGAYARQMLDYADAERPKLPTVADAGLHQDFWGLDRAKRQHHFATRLELLRLAVAYDFNAGHPLAIEQHLGHQRSGQDRQVRPVHPRIDIGAKHGQPLAVTNPDVGTKPRLSTDAPNFGPVRYRPKRLLMLLRSTSFGTSR